MRTNYEPMHSRDHGDSKRDIVTLSGGDCKRAESSLSVTTSLTHSLTHIQTLNLYISIQIYVSGAKAKALTIVYGTTMLHAVTTQLQAV